MAFTFHPCLRYPVIRTVNQEFMGRNQAAKVQTAFADLIILRGVENDSAGQVGQFILPVGRLLVAIYQFVIDLSIVIVHIFWSMALPSSPICNCSLTSVKKLSYYDFLLKNV
jgi:hypothetical protein